nr:helix-turn-helix transcriptional regulator [Thalassobacillus pellis]
MRMWLKGIRLQKDLTQEQTAIKSNISRSYYNHIESGVKNPTVETAKDIAFALEFKWTSNFRRKSH